MKVEVGVRVVDGATTLELVVVGESSADQSILQALSRQRGHAGYVYDACAGILTVFSDPTAD